MSIIQPKEINQVQDLKFIQLKKYQISSKNDNGSGSCLVVDHNNQIIFVCCQNELIFVPFNGLLNFHNWSKEFLSKVETQLNERVSIKINENNINSHFLSISSKGYGSKLAVACNDLNNSSLFLQFYDINSLYNYKEKSTHYNYFNFPIPGTSPVRVRNLNWHPEMNDNVFACSLTDGSFYVIYIADFDVKITTILFHLSNNVNVSAFSWSPKGKQIAISNNNSYFSQYKLQLNEYNLGQTVPFQEMKKYQLPEIFSTYLIKNIFWITTFNFIVICRNQEDNDNCYLLVSVPSSKAVNTQIKVVDFGRIIFESIECADPFESCIFFLENLIFFHINRSNEFGLIACNGNELNICENWFEVTLEDDYRLNMDDNSTLIRGLNFTHGTPKQFTVNQIVKGGLNRPFTLIYNSLGQLTIFLVDYENQMNEKFLKVPTSPKTTIRPLLSASSIPSKTEVLPSFSKPSLTNTNANASIFSNTSNQSIITGSKPSLINTTPAPANLQTNESVNFSSFNFNSALPESFNQAATTDNNFNNSVKSNVNTIPVTENKEKTISNLDKDNENAESSNINLLYIKEIQLNIEEFDNHLKKELSKIKNSFNELEIGNKKDYENIKHESKCIMKMLEELSSSYNVFNHDIKDLQNSCIELQYLHDKTRTLLDRNIDPNYRYILQQKNLDPFTIHRMQEIYKLKCYIEIQIRELNAKFDLEWKEWLQNKKSLSSTYLNSFDRLSSTLPHSSFIINDNNENEDNITGMAYKTLTKNQQLIENLRKQIDFICKKMFLIKKEKRSINEKLNDDVENLSQFLYKTSLNVPKKSDQVITIQCLSKDRKKILKRFLENRHTVPNIVCRSCSDNSPFNHKSRFISVLEKIKEKTKKPSDKIIDTNNVDVASEKEKPKIEEKSSPVPKSVDPVKTFSFNLKPSINTSMSNEKNLSPTFSSLPQTASVSFNLPLTKASLDNETTVTLSIPKTSPNTLTTKFSNISPSTKISESSSPDTFGKSGLIFSTKSNENLSSPNTSTTFNSLASSTGNEINKFSSSKLSPNLPLPTPPPPPPPTTTATEDKLSSLKVQNPPAIFPSLSNVNSSTNICKSAQLFSKFSFGEELAKQFNTTATATTTAIATITTVATIVTKTPIQFTISPTSTVSNTQTNESVSNTSLFKDFKFSGFGAKQTNSILPVSNVNDNKNLLVTQQQQENPQPSITNVANTTSSSVSNELTFSFNNALSLLSPPLSTSSTATSTLTPSTTIDNTSVENEAKTNLVSAPPVVSQPINIFSSTNSNLFGQNSSSAAASSTFGNLQSNSTSNQLNFQITSPVKLGQVPEQTIQKQSQPEQANVFGGFGAATGIGGTGIGSTSTGSTFSPVTAPTFSATTNFFGQSPPTIPATNNSLFSPSQSLQTSSTFTQSAFSVNSPQPQQQQQSPFSINQPSSSSSSIFLPLQNTNNSGGNVFGGSPIFGGFSFGGSSFGNMGQQSLKSFTNMSNTTSFGSMAFKNEPMLSFGSLANENNANINNNNNNNMAPSFGNNNRHFISSNFEQNCPNSDAFTQRRG